MKLATCSLRNRSFVAVATDDERVADLVAAESELARTAAIITALTAEAREMRRARIVLSNWSRLFSSLGSPAETSTATRATLPHDLQLYPAVRGRRLAHTGRPAPCARRNPLAQRRSSVETQPHPRVSEVVSQDCVSFAQPDGRDVGGRVHPSQSLPCQPSCGSQSASTKRVRARGSRQAPANSPRAGLYQPEGWGFRRVSHLGGFAVNCALSCTRGLL